MTATLNFARSSVAVGYDRVLAPALFVPWADRLVSEHGPWRGKRVVDLATGTGVVAQRLAWAVGRAGRVIGVDINRTMLELARERCAGWSRVSFAESPADAMDLVDGFADALVCQQGFQFFPDKPAAAREIRRVLRPGGRTVVTTWEPVSECEIFGALCAALDAIGESGIAARMRVPFDLMPAGELRAAFVQAGFERITVRRRTMDLRMPGGLDAAVEFAYSTPIGPDLTALDERKQEQFRSIYASALGALSRDGVKMGRMVSNELTAVAPE